MACDHASLSGMSVLVQLRDGTGDKSYLGWGLVIRFAFERGSEFGDARNVDVVPTLLCQVDICGARYSGQQGSGRS